MEQLNKRMEINGISKTFFSDKGYFTAIKDVSFDVNDGEFLVILGPGRCGKTVLLNIIAGLEQQALPSPDVPEREEVRTQTRRPQSSLRKQPEAPASPRMTQLRLTTAHFTLHFITRLM